jgi:hypothetical protein
MGKETKQITKEEHIISDKEFRQELEDRVIELINKPIDTPAYEEIIAIVRLLHVRDTV